MARWWHKTIGFSLNLVIKIATKTKKIYRRFVYFLIPKTPPGGHPPKISKKPPSYIIRMCAKILSLVKVNEMFRSTT